VGAKPLAITNCLNFGNPQRPEIMAQFVGCLEGMADACRALDFPIVSGNVSLYNESKATGGGSAILPTPAIGGVGLMEDVSKMATIGFKNEGEEIWLIGHRDGHLGQSCWLREVHGIENGQAPATDLELEAHMGWVVREMIAKEMVTAVHDVSDGGLAVSLAEMALAGKMGATITLPVATNPVGWLFGEDQGAYLVTATQGVNLGHFLYHDEDAVRYAYHGKIGVTGGKELTIGATIIPLANLCAAHESFFKNWME
jgi:phosphoribosylformylglycinamidine synthase subunit PurL